MENITDSTHKPPSEKSSIEKTSESNFATPGEKIFWLLQIIFSVIITKGIFDYKELLLNFPYNIIEIEFIALVGVYITTIWSWIDFTHVKYNNSYDKKDFRDNLRFLVDFLIVLSYAIILFGVDPIKDDNSKFIIHFLIAYPLIFFLYVLSGFLRISKFGKEASSIFLLIIYFLIYALLYSVYCYLFYNVLINNTTQLNYFSVITFIMVYISYRIVRIQVKKHKSN